MPKPKPLRLDQAQRNLTTRLGKVADRVRQLNTRFGQRPYRVFLIWLTTDGEVRGEGIEREYKRTEILPTPLVESLDALRARYGAAGWIPDGNTRVSEVSTQMTADQLSGYLDTSVEDKIPQPISFFYEIVEDGRGDNPSVRQRFHLAGPPVRRPDKFDWLIILERESGDRQRDGSSSLGVDDKNT